MRSTTVQSRLPKPCWWLPASVSVMLLGACAPAPQKVLSQGEVLWIKDQIREATANYVLRRDGDGVNPPDNERFARELFTADGVLEGYAPGGEIIFRWRINGDTGEIAVLEGLSREEIGRSSAAAAGRATTIFHYPVSIKFDKITATEVETRTTALVLIATKNEAGPSCALCASQPVTALITVYHDIWRFTSGGWKKHLSREFLLT